MAIKFNSDNNCIVKPGARERIAEKLKLIPQINAERPCKKCRYYNPSKLIACKHDYSCNFNHDNFVEK